MEGKKMIALRVTKDDLAQISKMSFEDGYDNRSAWLRKMVRLEITRREELKAGKADD
jgi:metal-responsive CopG/Arc/MetJ family transcriptional regulator